MNSVWNLDGFYSRGITGKGITTAVLDTGVYPHRAFLQPDNRICSFRDFVNGRRDPYDDNGHGTHVSGIIAGRSRGIGIAPDSRILALKVLDEEGNGKIGTMIRGIDWLLGHYREYGVRIVNISVGMPSEEDNPGQLILLKRVEQMWNQGLLVVVAAGNEGPAPGSVTVPGISAKAITVGALEDDRGGKNRRKRLYSGRGPVPATCVCKPDVIAPASGILSCDNSYDGYRRRSGTSMAAPLVSGLLALLLSMDPSLSNLEVKKRLRSSSIDMKQPRNQQGWGLVNPAGLLVN